MHGFKRTSFHKVTVFLFSLGFAFHFLGEIYAKITQLKSTYHNSLRHYKCIHSLLHKEKMCFLQSRYIFL